MSRRRRHGVVAWLALSAVSAAGCEADLGTAGCRIAHQTTLPGSPLTLLPNARLDVVGAGYVLMGYDAPTNAVRWATLSTSGTLGTERAYPLPVGVQSALFAVAAAPAAVQPPGGGDAVLTGPVAGDTVLIGYVGTDSTGTKGELSMIAVPADGSAPSGPAAVIYEFPDGVPPASSLAMVSSLKGVHAGLAWVDDQMGRVMYTAIDGSGAMVGAPTPVSPALPGFRGLAFTPGKDQVTLVYYSDDVNTNSLTGPGWIIADGNEAGAIDSSIALVFSGQPATPAVVTATAAGYALAWQDSAGAWLGVYKSSNQTVSPPHLFAPSSEFGGALLQPPLVALTSLMTDFGVVFQQPRDAELWRLDPTGNRRSGALIFPSAAGSLGTVSAVPALAPDTGLVVTYADYAGGDAPSGPAGDRLFVNATCY